MILHYRSPNVIIDEHEWHVVVVQTSPRNRPVTRFMFRSPVSGGAWSVSTAWQGRKPKGLRKFFSRYNRSIKDALASVRIAPRTSVYAEAA